MFHQSSGGVRPLRVWLCAVDCDIFRDTNGRQSSCPSQAAGNGNGVNGMVGLRAERVGIGGCLLQSPVWTFYLWLVSSNTSQSAMTTR